MKVFARMMLVPIALVGCRSSSNPSTTDAPKSTTDSNGSTDGSNSNACTSYTPSTIKAMRMGTKSDCFELDNVVSIGTTPSKKSPNLFVQDAGGGDYSGLMTKCSSTSTTHPCSVASTVAAIADGTSVTVKGTYIKSASSGFEEFYLDSITSNGTATMPAAATATLAQIERSSTAHNLVFERVTVTIGANDTLKMYDWTPAEFADTSATACPYQFGFGMIPKSTSGATATPACTSGTAQPAGQTTPDPTEVLIGTDFYSGFTVSSDCRCAKTFSDMEPASGSTLGGTIGGILVFDTTFNTDQPYMYLDPETATDAPITGTVAGM